MSASLQWCSACKEQDRQSSGCGDRPTDHGSASPSCSSTLQGTRSYSKHQADTKGPPSVPKPTTWCVSGAGRLPYRLACLIKSCTNHHQSRVPCLLPDPAALAQSVGLLERAGKARPTRRFTPGIMEGPGKGKARAAHVLRRTGHARHELRQRSSHILAWGVGVGSSHRLQLG